MTMRSFQSMATLVAILFATVLVTVAATTPTSLRGNSDGNQDVQDIVEEPVQVLPQEDSSHQDRRRVLRVPDSFSGLDKDFVDLAILSAKLSQCVNLGTGIHSECSGAQMFVSTWGPDKAMVHFANGICFGAFQATTMSTADWGQNLNPGMATDVCSPFNNICCPSRRGFRNAYKATSYLEDFEAALDTCKTTMCGSGRNCQTVLTGTSQGGAVAMVGAVYKNPDAVITFGQPPTMEEPCYAYDTSRIYRFVNTLVNRKGNLLYDIVPFLSFGATDHMGHLFTLADDHNNVAYYKNHEAPDIRAPHLSVAGIGRVHSLFSYIERLENLDTTKSIGLDGWAIGERCSSLDSECTAPHFCVDGTCSPGNNGDFCIFDGDCKSGRCDSWFSSRQCYAQLPDGSLCDEGSDCLSGRCKFTWKLWRCVR